MKHQNPDCNYIEIGEGNCPKCFNSKKCRCGHTIEYHYLAPKHKNGITCHKDNCFNWQNCDIDKNLIDETKPLKH